MVLQAEPELIKIAISMKMIKGTLMDAGQGFLVEFKKLGEEKIVEVVHDRVMQMLSQFDSVFHEPQGLPPHRRESSCHYNLATDLYTEFEALLVPSLLEG